MFERNCPPSPQAHTRRETGRQKSTGGKKTKSMLIGSDYQLHTPLSK